MAFTDKEISTQDGRPLTLYRFDWGLTHWFYTSADRVIPLSEVVNGATVTVNYQPIAVADNGMVQGSSSQNDFTMTAPRNIPLVTLFRGTPPSETIWLTVRRMHYGEPDAPIYWKGTVTNVKGGNDISQASIIGRPISASLKRGGLRLCWTRECPHFLYDMDCQVNPEAYRIDGVIAALTGNTITIGADIAQGDQWLRGGFVSWPASIEGTVERRMIENQSGRVLTIFGLTDGLTVGTPLKMYPGCDRLPSTCDGKYGNIANYGGFDKMPGDTPFGKAIW